MPRLQDIKRKPRRSARIEAAKNAARPYRAQPEAVSDLSDEQLALAREIVSKPIENLAKRSRDRLDELNDESEEILARLGPETTKDGARKQIREAVDEAAADVAGFSATAFGQAENAIENAIRSTGGDPRAPLTLREVVVDFARDAKGALDLSVLRGTFHGLDLARRLDATQRALEGIADPTELAILVRDAMTEGDSLVAWSIESWPLGARGREAFLRRAKPGLKTSWEELRETFRRARNPSGFAALDARRDLGRGVLDIADATFVQIANVSGMNGPFLIEKLLDPKAGNLRRLVG